MPDDLPRPVPEGPRDRQGAAHPGLRDAGLRGRRRHRDDHRRSSTRTRDLETTIVTVDLDMLQLVTPRVRLMTTRSGVENTVMYDVAKIDERFGLRPDQMVDYKALKGDPTDNIPGVPGVGEKTAAKLIREFGDARRAARERLDEVTPGQARRQAPRARRPDPDGPRAVADRPRPADRARPRGRPPRRLRPRHRRPAVPRVRVPDADRAAARRWPASPPSSGPRRSGPSPRAATCRRRASPGGRTAGAPVADRAGPRERRAPAAPRLRHRGAGRRRPTAAPRRRTVAAARSEWRLGRSSRPATCRPRSRRRSSIRAGSRSAAPDRDRRARPTGSPPSPPSARRSSPTTRGRAAARRSPSRSPGADGRVVAAEGAEAADALRRLVEASGVPLVGHEVKPVLVARFADDPEAPATAGRLRHPDRGLHPERRPAQPDDRRRRGREPRPDPAAGDGAAGDRPRRARGAVGDRGPRAARAAARRGRARAPVPRHRAAADPGPRPDGGGRRRPRPRGAGRPRPPSSAPRSTASSRRSTSTSATSSTSAARSSSSRSCSSS